MKINNKTIMLVTVLSIFLSLAFIVVSLLIHLDNDLLDSIEEETPSEATAPSIDSTEEIFLPSDQADSTIGNTAEEESAFTESQGSNTVSATIAPEDTRQDTTQVDTTVELTDEIDSAEATTSEIEFEDTTAFETTEETTVTEITDTQTTEEETTAYETTNNETTVEETSVETTEESTDAVTEPPEDTKPETTVHTHSYPAWAVYKYPTCEAEGLLHRSCSCGETETLPLPASGHTEKVLHAVEATCKSAGKTEGRICSVCNMVFVAQTVLPRLECKYENLICINCGQVKEITLSLTAPFAGLYKADTLECLYSVSENVRTPPASLTKMITACVAIENMPLDHIITVGSEQSLVPKYSSLCYIYRGNKIKLYDLLTGMLLCSGNDAAYSIAASVGRYVSGNKSMSDQEAIDCFCSLMNDYAKEIGAKNTNFTTPDGSDSQNQYTTVKDIAIITAHAMKNETIAKIVATQYKKVVFASGELAKWTNTNELIDPNSDYYTECVTGFKTGGTENAGKCLSATFEYNGETYIAIVLGCDDNDARYENILKLINIIK